MKGFVMKKTKGERAVKTLSLIVPEKDLDIQKKQLSDVVKTTETNELHRMFAKLNGFMAMLTDLVKIEFIKRAQKKAGKVVSEIGEITVHTRNNYTYNDEKIKDFLESKDLALGHVFDTEYVVITRNAKTIETLLEKGVIAESLKVNNKKFEAVLEDFSKLDEFRYNNPTTYLKGL